MLKRKIKRICATLIALEVIFSGIPVLATSVDSDISVDEDAALEKTSATSKPVIDSIEGKKNSDGTVTFTVKASGGEDVGTGLLFYKFYALDDNKKKIEINQDEGIGQNYSLNNKYTCKPTSKGKHNIYVEVQNSNNETVSDSKYFEEDGEENPPLTDEKNVKVNSLTVSGDYKLGQKLTIKASATADDSDLTYKFVYIDSDDKEHLIKESANSTVSWTPEDAGDYVVKVYVTDSSNNSAYKSKNISITDEDNNNNEDEEGKLAVTLKSNTTSFKVGSKIKFTASATGSSGDVTYKFYIKSDSEDCNSGNYKSSNTYTYTPEEEGTYEIYVIAKDDNGQVKSSVIKAKVKADNSSSDDEEGNDAPSGDFSKGIIPLGILSLGAIVCIKKSKKNKNL